MLPYLVVNTGMLPHQFSSVVEGLFGPMHGEFERTPKAASVGGTSVGVTPPTTRRYAVRIHWPYVLTETFFIGYQTASAVLLASGGLAWCAVGAAYLATCVLYVAFFYGDHAGKVAFIFEKRVARVAGPARGVDLRGRMLALIAGGRGR